MGHIGLTPQTHAQLGGYRVQGKSTREALQLLEDAEALQRAGAFAVVLECVPVQLAEEVTPQLSASGSARLRGEALMVQAQAVLWPLSEFSSVSSPERQEPEQQQPKAKSKGRASPPPGKGQRTAEEPASTLVVVACPQLPPVARNIPQFTTPPTTPLFIAPRSSVSLIHRHRCPPPLMWDLTSMSNANTRSRCSRLSMFRRMWR